MKNKTTFLKSLFFLIMVLITFGWAQAQTLVAHYNFNNSLNDETTTYHLSASTGFTPTFETGQDGTANGAVSGFTAPDYLESSVNFEIDGNESRTMAAWIKIPVTGGTGAIVGLGIPSAGTRWTYSVVNTNLRIEIQGSGFNANGVIQSNTWHHVAVVYDGPNTTATLYVNGVSINSNTSFNVNTTASLLRVGNDYNNANQTPPTPNRGFKGAIDDLRIYTGAANAAFVLNLYNSTLSIEDTKSNLAFNTYPNPVKDKLYFSSNEITSVEIYNLLGSKIGAQEVVETLDMTRFTSGVYLLKCFDSKGLARDTIRVVKK